MTEINKLLEEMATLRDSKNLLEKKLRHCNCTSVTAATAVGNVNVKGTKANDQTKVDQITASAKAEIQKLVNHELLC